jgi:hypothetical protein
MPRKFAPSAVGDAARATRRTAAMPRPPVLAAIAIVVCGLALAGFAQPVRHQLSLSFGREPAQYSELYFTRLPRMRNGQLTLAFRIANRGTKDASYRYSIRLAPGNSLGVTIRRGTTSIAPNEVADVTVTAKVRKATGPRTATVTLAGGGTKEIRVHARLVTGSAT